MAVGAPPAIRLPQAVLKRESGQMLACRPVSNRISVEFVVLELPLLM